MDSVAHFRIGQIWQVADSFGGFEVDHLALVAQPLVEELHHWTTKGRVVFGELGG